MAAMDANVGKLRNILSGHGEFSKQNLIIANGPEFNSTSCIIVNSSAH